MTARVVDIEHWRPARLADVCGNDDFKEYVQDFIRMVRRQGHTAGFNLLYIGEGRSGKTSGITLTLQLLGCLDLNFGDLAPCGKCFNCRHHHHIHGNRDWEAVVDRLDDSEKRTPIHLHVSVVNAPELNEAKADELLQYLASDFSKVKVVYMDEILRLDHRVAAKLLSPMDRFPVTWLASSAYLPTAATHRQRGSVADERRKILEMFHGRFTFKLRTQPPSTREMVAWLSARCEEFGIVCEQPEITLARLAERSHRVPGLALQVLNRAHKKRDSLLTLKIVESHCFDLDS